MRPSENETWFASRAIAEGRRQAFIRMHEYDHAKKSHPVTSAVFISETSHVCVCVCVRAHAWVGACVRACMLSRVRACVRVCAHTHAREARNRDWRSVTEFQSSQRLPSYRGGCTFWRQRSLPIRSQLGSGWAFGLQLSALHTFKPPVVALFDVGRGRPKLEKIERRRSSWRVSHDLRLLKIVLEVLSWESTNYCSRSTDQTPAPRSTCLSAINHVDLQTGSLQNVMKCSNKLRRAQRQASTLVDQSRHWSHRGRQRNHAWLEGWHAKNVTGWIGHEVANTQGPLCSSERNGPCVVQKCWTLSSLANYIFPLAACASDRTDSWC